MVVEVALIFKGVSLGLGAAKYLGIVEDKLAAKLDQLAGSEFEAGMRALRQASGSESEQAWLLREARGRFNKAISLEKGLRLALAHLGLALCHWHLGDRANAKQSINELLRVQPPSVPLAATIAEKVASAPWWVAVLLPGALRAIAPSAAELLKAEVVEEQAKLANLQQSAQGCFPEM
jgi:tetratricopeptide (TPR) repeat protein